MAIAEAKVTKTEFAPTLSGRENIQINGALLGMSPYEIDSVIDEIIDFSEIVLVGKSYLLSCCPIISVELDYRRNSRKIRGCYIVIVASVCRR